MMDLYKEMMAETISITRGMNLPETTPLSGDTQKLKEGANAVADKVISSADLSEDPQSDDGQPHGTFVVGGSAFGWNFVTFLGGKPEYYGRTKEMFRAENVVVTDKGESDSPSPKKKIYG